MNKNIKKIAKFLLFAVLFLSIYTYTRDVLRNKFENEALGIIMNKPNNSYDVILAGPSHMQNALQPAQLFGEYGIVSCNTATSAQSVPTTYYVLKEMVARHSPKLIVLDLFCVFLPENFFTSTRFHQAIDNFPLSINKSEAIMDLADTSKSEYFINYLLYHSRWKELTKSDYTVHDEFNETYQFHALAYPYPAPFIPVYEKAPIPEVTHKYLEKIVDLCKENEIELLLTVIPYRADIDNNDTSAVLQQQMYNYVEDLAKEWEVDYFNGLHHLDEIGFDFTTDMIEWSHVNASGTEKLSTYYGKMIKENYDIPDRSEEQKYSEWHEDYQEYKVKLEEAKNMTIQ